MCEYRLLTAIITCFILCLDKFFIEAKVFERCELARTLHQRNGLSREEVAIWVCIAQHSSELNSAAYARGFAGGSHGLFQISDIYWCSHTGKDYGCNVACEKLRDNDLTDDIACARTIFGEHQRLTGDGYTAWNVYGQFCRANSQSYIGDCFSNDQQRQSLSRYQAQAVTEHFIYSNGLSNHKSQKRGKIYDRCELAQELYFKHKLPIEHLATWVCIAQHESNFDTTAQGRLNADGSIDHGLFQISDIYWCSNDYFSGGGKACGLSCSKLRDSDITDDVRCIRRIYDEHTRISGDGFNAWTVYNPYCRNQQYERISHCFKNQAPLQNSLTTASSEKKLALTYTSSQHTINHAHKRPVTKSSAHQYYHSNPFLKHVPSSPSHQAKTHNYQNKHTHSFHHAPSQSPAYGTAFHSHDLTYKPKKGKVYKRCELATDLFFIYKFPIQDIAMWVCIAEHESRFNTAAIGRLNADGSADHGLFQISDLYWCTHDSHGGKGCNLPCHRLLDTDITDDIKCLRTIYDEHTRISGDGFTAWTVYNRDCKGQQYSVEDCFDKSTFGEETSSTTLSKKIAQNPNSLVEKNKPEKQKIFSKCELAQELYFQHSLPLEQIPTWVCIAKHESNYNTAAVGRLNADGSADHGIFQISDLYWCSNGELVGKACNIPCSKLLDSDITDDVECVKIIYEEHTRISGDGFTAWTVYQPYCQNLNLEYVSSCFDENVIAAANENLLTSATKLHKQFQQNTFDTQKKFFTKGESEPDNPYKHNPFLNKLITNIRMTSTPEKFAQPYATGVENYSRNPVSKEYFNKEFILNSEIKGIIPSNSVYSGNPFLKKYFKHDLASASQEAQKATNPSYLPNNFVTAQAEINTETHYRENPFLKKYYKTLDHQVSNHNTSSATEIANSQANDSSIRLFDTLNPFLKKYYKTLDHQVSNHNTSTATEIANSQANDSSIRLFDTLNPFLKKYYKTLDHQVSNHNTSTATVIAKSQANDSSIRLFHTINNSKSASERFLPSTTTISVLKINVSTTEFKNVYTTRKYVDIAKYRKANRKSTTTRTVETQNLSSTRLALESESTTSLPTIKPVTTTLQIPIDTYIFLNTTAKPSWKTTSSLQKTVLTLNQSYNTSSAKTARPFNSTKTLLKASTARTIVSQSATETTSKPPTIFSTIYKPSWKTTLNQRLLNQKTGMTTLEPTTLITPTDKPIRKTTACTTARPLNLTKTLLRASSTRTITPKFISSAKTTSKPLTTFTTTLKPIWKTTVNPNQGFPNQKSAWTTTARPLDLTEPLLKASTIGTTISTSLNSAKATSTTPTIFTTILKPFWKTTLNPKHRFTNQKSGWATSKPTTLTSIDKPSLKTTSWTTTARPFNITKTSLKASSIETTVTKSATTTSKPSTILSKIYNPIWKTTLNPNKRISNQKPAWTTTNGPLNLTKTSLKASSAWTTVSKSLSSVKTTSKPSTILSTIYNPSWKTTLNPNQRSLNQKTGWATTSRPLNYSTTTRTTLSKSVSSSKPTSTTPTIFTTILKPGWRTTLNPNQRLSNQKPAWTTTNGPLNLTKTSLKASSAWTTVSKSLSSVKTTSKPSTISSTIYNPSWKTTLNPNQRLLNQKTSWTTTSRPLNYSTTTRTTLSKSVSSSKPTSTTPTIFTTILKPGWRTTLNPNQKFSNSKTRWTSTSGPLNFTNYSFKASSSKATVTKSLNSAKPTSKPSTILSTIYNPSWKTTLISNQRLSNQKTSWTTTTARPLNYSTTRTTVSKSVSTSKSTTTPPPISTTIYKQFWKTTLIPNQTLSKQIAGWTTTVRPRTTVSKSPSFAKTTSKPPTIFTTSKRPIWKTTLNPYQRFPNQKPVWTTTNKPLNFTRTSLKASSTSTTVSKSLSSAKTTSKPSTVLSKIYNPSWKTTLIPNQSLSNEKTGLTTTVKSLNYSSTRTTVLKSLSSSKSTSTTPTISTIIYKQFWKTTLNPNQRFSSSKTDWATSKSTKLTSIDIPSRKTTAWTTTARPLNLNKSSLKASTTSTTVSKSLSSAKTTSKPPTTNYKPSWKTTLNPYQRFLNQIAYRTTTVRPIISEKSLSKFHNNWTTTFKPPISTKNTSKPTSTLTTRFKSYWDTTTSPKNTTLQAFLNQKPRSTTTAPPIMLTNNFTKASNFQTWTTTSRPSTKTILRSTS